MKETTTAPARLLDIREASKFLGISVRTVRRLVRDRRVAHYRHGLKLFFSKHDLRRVGPITGPLKFFPAHKDQE